MPERLFYNYPKLFTSQNYEEAKSSIIKSFEKCNDLNAIFEYGSLNNIGISDIDIIVVLKNKVSKNCHKLISKDVLPKQTLEVLDFASIIIVPENRIDEILIWDDLKLKQISGEELKIKKYNALEIEIARIIDWLPERIIRIEEVIISDKINIRKTLGLLKSACYTLLNLIDKFNIKNSSFELLIANVNELRKNWFAINEKEKKLKLIDFLFETKKNLLIALDLFDEWLFSNYNLKFKNLKKEIKLRFPHNYSYTFKENTKQRLSINSDGGLELNLSNFYLFHFQNYSSGEGLISKKLKESFNNDVSNLKVDQIPIKYNILLKRRIDLCNTWAYFLKENNFKNGLFKMGWFYNN